MLTVNRPLCTFSLLLSLAALFGFFQAVWAADTVDKNIQQIIMQEITRHQNPQELIKILQQIGNEKNPTKKVKLISSLLETDNRNMLNKEKQPYLWAGLHQGAGDALQHLPKPHRSDDIEQAIDHYLQALQVFSLEAFPQDWATTQNNLAEVYRYRIRSKRADNLEQVIAHLHQTLLVYTLEVSPKEWAATQYNLANTYGERIYGERADNLEQAIRHYEQALLVDTHEASPQNWASTQNSLGETYRQRIRGERADNLEQAIEHLQRALLVYTRDAFPQEWASAQNNLGNVYSDRIWGEHTDNLEKAIEHYQQALLVKTRETFPQDWAATQNNLANAYLYRIRGEQADNLEQAIKHHQQALLVYTREAFPQDWAMSQHNLATVYSARIRGERADNLKQAIQHFEQALQIYTREAAPQQWATIQNGLAAAYHKRIGSERADNLEQALEQAADNLEQVIEHYQQALLVLTREAFPQNWAMIQNNLATAYSVRIRGEPADNLEQAIAHYRLALKVYNRKTFPEEFMKSTTGLTQVLLETHEYPRALIHLTAALETNEERLQQISFTPEERRRLVEQAQDMFANAVWAAAQSGDAARAAQLLEWGKTRLLRENLALDTDNLRGVPAETQARLRELKTLVSNLEIRSQRQNDEVAPEIRQQLRAELQDKRKQLREALQAAGITATQAPKDEDLRQWLAALPPGSALVAPVFSDFGTVVLVLPAGAKEIGKAHVLVLPEFTRKDLRAVTRGDQEGEVGGYLKAYWEWTGEADRDTRKEKQKAWQGQLNTNLDALRGGLLEPVLKRLRELEIKPGADLFWLPDSDAGLLPVHAATVDGKPLLAQYTMHFVPSLYSAYTARQRLAGKPGERLLALVNPTENLPFTPIEGELVSRFFTDRAALQGQDGKRDKLMLALSDKPAYLHLSTHGKYDWQTPLESGLSLANGERLTLGDLLQKPDFLAGSRLAVLSACETGITDIRAPAEALGLPAAFLQAGVPGVVSTLWTVDDLSTTFLLGKFYELHQGEGVEPAKALAQAQEWLRTATYKNLWALLQPRFNLPKIDATAQEIAGTFKQLLHDSTQAGNLVVWLNAARKTPDAQPYQEPYYWAGFVFSGV